jgi:hypothetical protein
VQRRGGLRGGGVYQLPNPIGKHEFLRARGLVHVSPSTPSTLPLPSMSPSSSLSPLLLVFPGPPTALTAIDRSSFYISPPPSQRRARHHLPPTGNAPRAPVRRRPRRRDGKAGDKGRGAGLAI